MSENGWKCIGLYILVEDIEYILKEWESSHKFKLSLWRVLAMKKTPNNFLSPCRSYKS